MVIVDLIRLHYCLSYEFEPYKSIIIAKWKSIPELTDFVCYVIPQWFEGTFTNWQIFRSPPGFANTNNPLESFNKIIKAQFTNYDKQPIIAFRTIVINHLIPFYSVHDKAFLFYRVPHKLTKSIAKKLDEAKFSMKSVVECTYTGVKHIHTVNFSFKSCTCRWFMAFTVCAHLVAACDQFDQHLDGHTKKKTFVYRPRRGPKKRAITFSAQAFNDNPMPVIAIPAIASIEDQHQSLFLIDTNNMPSFPEINPSVEAVTLDIPAAAAKIKRAYKKKVVVETVVIVVLPKRSKRLQKDPIRPYYPFRPNPTKKTR